MVETTQEKEQRANETIDMLKQESDNLTKLVEKGTERELNYLFKFLCTTELDYSNLIPSKNAGSCIEKRTTTSIPDSH